MSLWHIVVSRIAKNVVLERPPIQQQWCDGRETRTYFSCFFFVTKYTRHVWKYTRADDCSVVLVRQFNQMFNLFLQHEFDAWLDSGSLCVCVFVWCLLNANISDRCCKLWKLIYVHVVLLRAPIAMMAKSFTFTYSHFDTRAAVFLWCCWKWWWQKYRCGMNSPTNRIRMADEWRVNIGGMAFCGRSRAQKMASSAMHS